MIISSSCQDSPDSIVASSSPSSFAPPVLIKTEKSADVIDTTRQLESITYPLIISKNDSIDFEGIPQFKRFTLITDSIEYSVTNNLELFVDTSEIIVWKFWEETPIEAYLIHVDKNGNEIPKEPYITPYDKVKKFPVYIINNTDSIQAIENHDGRIIVIQEALSEQGDWQGIEYFEFSGCGNSYGRNLIKPNEYMLFGANQYRGDFKTKLRVRLRTNGKTILSNEFTGFINRSQLEKIEPTGFSWNQYLTE